MNGKDSRKLKILMVGPDRSVHGGISGVVNGYYAAGLINRVDLTYIGTMKEGSRFYKLCTAVRAYFRFCREVRDCDIVHIHFSSDASFWRKSFFIRRAHRAGKKIVLHQHGGDFRNFYYRDISERQRAYVRNTLDLADVMLVISPALHELFSDIVDTKNVPIIDFPNAITIPPEARHDYRRHDLLFLGRICRDKGICELLEAVQKLKTEFPNLHLYLGGIYEEPELRAMAESMPETVTWLGWITGEEKEKRLTQCGIFVLPSYFEGQPVSILEAMAHSCAIAASDVGGIPEMVKDGETGLLCEPRNPESLTAVLRKLLSDPALCERLGSAAREKVSREFSLDTSLDRLIQLYQELKSR